MAPYLVLAAALTTHYVTYVVTRSDFPPVRWLRDLVFNHTNEGSPLAYLVTCAYCTAAYVALLVVIALNVRADVRWPVLLWGLCASVAGTLVEVVDALRSVTMRSRTQ